MKKLNEIKVSLLKVGQEYTIMTDLGRLNEGDKVKVVSIMPWQGDVKITLVNEKGTRDYFILDKNDEIDLD